MDLTTKGVAGRGVPRSTWLIAFNASGRTAVRVQIAAPVKEPKLNICLLSSMETWTVRSPTRKTSAAISAVTTKNVSAGGGGMAMATALLTGLGLSRKDARLETPSTTALPVCEKKSTRRYHQSSWRVLTLVPAKTRTVITLG